MPYITSESRLNYDTIVAEIEKHPPQSPGDLTYLIYKLLQAYVGYSSSFRIYNAAVGACENAKAEFQRRVVAPYEDRKRAVNGDV